LRGGREVAVVRRPPRPRILGHGRSGVKPTRGAVAKAARRSRLWHAPCIPSGEASHGPGREAAISANARYSLVFFEGRRILV